MNRLYSVAILFFVSFYSLAQTINQKKLDAEISKLNDEKKYEISIIRLENILIDKKSSNYDKFNAYLQKYITYKRLYNYTEAENNLNLAYEEGLKSDKVEETKSRVLIEKIFINFDLQKIDKVNELLKQVTDEKLKYVHSETKAFYYSVLAHFELKKGNNKNAEKILFEAVKVLEETNPRHLPNIYRVLVDLYSREKNDKKVLEMYNKGLYYAEKYNVDIYKLIMYETMTHYYRHKKDFKNAQLFQSKVIDAQSEYNPHNTSGSLTILEKQLLKERKNFELENNKIIIVFLIIIAIILTALILLLFKLFATNKKARVLIEKENNKILNELKQLTAKEDNSLKLDENKLTARQIEIINLVKQGKTNKEIGNQLFISENTVKYHLKIIYEILDIENRYELK